MSTDDVPPGGVPPPAAEHKSDEDLCEPFEGPEKVLEVDFSPSKGPADGLRSLSKDCWDAVLKDAGAEILSTMRNSHFDAYILSESSLFVYPHTVIIKTCGRTTLLRAIPLLLKFSKEIDMEVEWVAYTRKDFLFPAHQLFPHTNPNEEVEYLKKYFDGDAFVLGPITGDHWFVFIADHCDRPSSESKDRTLDLMMFDIDPATAAMFTKSPEDKDVKTAKSVTESTSIDHILPGAKIDAWMFDPCGYSCNGMLYEAYFTIHVTPEKHSSYASFETNIKQGSYSAMIKHVLEIFKPKRFTMTLFADQWGAKEIVDDPCQPFVGLTRGLAYTQTAKCHADFGDYVSSLSNYTKCQTPVAYERPRGESV